MKSKSLMTLAFPFFFIFICWSCTSVRQFTPPATWPTISKSESDFRRYYDENASNLDAIEGIWTMTERQTWRNVFSGMTGTLPSRENIYRIAIVRDTTNTNYDFVAVVLESEYPHWLPGRVKARFRKTAYENLYEVLWYMSDYSPSKKITSWTNLAYLRVHRPLSTIIIHTSNIIMKPFSLKPIHHSVGNHA